MLVDGATEGTRMAEDDELQDGETAELPETPGPDRDEPSGPDRDGPPAPTEPTEMQPPDPSPAGPTGTTIMPAVPDSGPTPPATDPTPPRWSARARVPSPADEPDEPAYPPPYDAGYDSGYRSGYGHQGDHGDEWSGPPPGRPAWVMPTVIAICVVLLLGAIGLGLWLVVRGLSNENPGPAATTAPAATTPTTTKPVTPTSTGPVAQPVPQLRGQDYDAAAATLTARGLRPARSDEPSADIPAGKVTRTDPAAGTTPGVGTTVIVYVSNGKPSPTTTPASPSPSPS
jgi:hypothetical protein